jgi:hypothetical protein
LFGVAKIHDADIETRRGSQARAKQRRRVLDLFPRTRKLFTFGLAWILPSFSKNSQVMLGFDVDNLVS